MATQEWKTASRYLTGVFLILVPLLLPACNRHTAEEKGGEQKKSEDNPVDAIAKDARERVRANVRDLMKGWDMENRDTFLFSEEGRKASVLKVDDGLPLKNISSPLPGAWTRWISPL